MAEADKFVAPAHPFHVLIVGAGTTGLLLAQGLKEAGVSCTVFERETSETYKNRPMEWGMTLHWGAEYVFQKLPEDLRRRIPSTRCNPHANPETWAGVGPLTTYNGQTGEVMWEMHGDNPVRVSRSKIRKLFSEGLNIQYGRQLCGMSFKDSTVIANFSDRTQVTGSCIIGCDGARSQVREVLVGSDAAKLQLLPISFLNCTQSFTADQALHLQQLHPGYKLSIYPGTAAMLWLSLQDVPNPAKPETWLFQIMMMWRGEPEPESLPQQEDRIRHFKTTAKSWVEPWKSAVDWLRDDTHVLCSRLSFWEPGEWDNHNGMVSLAGDAAHPMPPNRGQGLNNAMLDASNLIDALAKKPTGADLKSAIDAYEAEMRDRGTREVQLSTKQALVTSRWDTVMDNPARKVGMRRVMPNEAL